MFKYITINFEKPICDCFGTDSESKEGYYWNLATDEGSKKIYLVVVCRVCDTSIVIPQSKVGALFVFDYVEPKTSDQVFQNNNVVVFSPKMKDKLKHSSEGVEIPKGEDKNE